jgi:hypothetical protein
MKAIETRKDKAPSSHFHFPFPFSQYSCINDPLITEFIESIPQTLDKAVQAVASMVHMKTLEHAYEHLTARTRDVYHNRVWLTQEVHSFHNKCGTMFTNTGKAMAGLLQPNSEIFVSIHQPNLFAYSGVFKKIVLLQVLKKRMQALGRGVNNGFPKGIHFVNLFLIVDHDFMEDHWMRLAQLPSINNGDGALELKMPVRHADRWQMVCNMPKPNPAVVNQWHKQVVRWMRDLSAFEDEDHRMIMASRLDRFWDRVVDEAYRRADSYAEFNAFIISNIVNKIFGYDTLFVPLSKLSECFKYGYNFLLQNNNEYMQALAESAHIFDEHGLATGLSQNSMSHAPLWLHCDQCGSKASAKIIIDSDDDKHGRKLGGVCMGCKKQREIYLNADKSIHENDADRVSPRAIPILMLLSRELGISVYASGTGGSMRYVMSGRRAIERLKIDMPITLAWTGEDRYFGIGQWSAMKSMNLQSPRDCDNLCDSLRRELVQYSTKIAPYLQLRQDYVEKGQDMTSLLKDISSIKQDQRRMRALLTRCEKVRKAVTVRPCIIDYAVNFGLDRAADLWEANLIENDRLDVPVTMI